MTTRRKPGPAPAPGPKRTARLVLQVTSDEYDQVLAATVAAGYTYYSEYIRAALGLPTVAPRRTPPTTGPEQEPTPCTK
jgi:hypothetical protein